MPKQIGVRLVHLSVLGRVGFKLLLKKVPESLLHNLFHLVDGTVNTEDIVNYEDSEEYSFPMYP